MMLKKGIQVKVMVGKDKGKTGEILEIIRKRNLVKTLEEALAEKERLESQQSRVFVETEEYTFGDLLKIPFFATKKLPFLGSIPAKTAGAPSHLTLTEPSCTPPNVSLNDLKARIASLVPLTPP